MLELAWPMPPAVPAKSLLRANGEPRGQRLPRRRARPLEAKVSTGADRAPLMRRLLNDEVWLVHPAAYPVSQLSPSARSRALVEHTRGRTQQILDITPGPHNHLPQADVPRAGLCVCGGRPTVAPS